MLDCDNTLRCYRRRWYRKYPIGQDGVGLAYMEFQKAIKKLRESGIILALVSKNNNDDVINVLEKHESMVLKKEDIAAFKLIGMKRVKIFENFSKDLFLGLDSFVFWMTIHQKETKSK